MKSDKKNTRDTVGPPRIIEGGCVNVEQVIDKSLIKKVLNKAGCFTRWTDFNFAANMRESANLA